MRIWNYHSFVTYLYRRVQRNSKILPLHVARAKRFFSKENLRDIPTNPKKEETSHGTPIQKRAQLMEIFFIPNSIYCRFPSSCAKSEHILGGFFLKIMFSLSHTPYTTSSTTQNNNKTLTKNDGTNQKFVLFHYKMKTKQVFNLHFTLKH